MSDIAIKFENISKQYRLGLVSTRTLSHDLNRWWTMNIRGKEDPYLKIGETNDRSKKGGSEYVWALKDIDFEVKQGDILGIIGKNGAGKSTLLKILSKVTTPTTGSIKAHGRIASLLEVGTGFHPEMTGRENIYMNGAIMGMTKSEITRKLDEIVDFAGVERYLDTPVKRYSSGMMVRLGFAVAAHLEPEILVVDEVLAVGDAEFQKKAIGKMQDVSRGEGRTVLFVSHNMGSISSLCNKGIILANGLLTYEDNIASCVSHYILSNNDKSIYIGHNVTNDIYYKQISIQNGIGEEAFDISCEDSVTICFKLGYNKKITNAVLSFTLLDLRMNPLFTSHFNLLGDENIKATIPRNILLKGVYYVKPILHIPNLLYLDVCKDVLSFNLVDVGCCTSVYNNDDLGALNINVEWLLI